jgi:mannose-6-phosphate isomerase-like protein (cupin superfamily)
MTDFGPPSTIHVTKAGQGEHWQILSDVTTIKAAGEATSDALLLLENLVPAGGGPPALHRHGYAEAFYVLEGEFEVTTFDAAGALSPVRITAGDTVAIPSWVWHNFKNVGATKGKFLAVHSPSGMEHFAREIGTPIADPLNPPDVAGPLSAERMRQMMEIITKYMDVLPPSADLHV